MKTLTITIAPDATVHVETAGFTGSACLAATKAVEDEIGAVDDRKKKPEFFANTVNPTQQVGGA